MGNTGPSLRHFVLIRSDPGHQISEPQPTTAMLICTKSSTGIGGLNAPAVPHLYRHDRATYRPRTALTVDVSAASAKATPRLLASLLIVEVPLRNRDCIIDLFNDACHQRTISKMLLR